MEKVCIETERLILRSFENQDVQPLFELWSNPRVNCYVQEKMESPGEAVAYIARANPEYDLAVCEKATNALVGTLFGAPEHGDTFSPCWNFLPEYCGKGYATEAVEAYLAYLFCKKNIRRVYAYTEDDNLASQRVCEKLGFRREGLFLEFISFVNHPDGTPRYENTYQYALLIKEWELRRKNKA